MSIWTHVTGVIEVDTYARSTAEAQYIAQTVVNHLPRVEGSEGPMDVYVVMKRGHSFSSNVDEFEQHSNLHNAHHRFGMFEEQTGLFLILDGHLRDVEYADGYRQTIRFLTRLAKRLYVDDIMVKVESGEDTGYILDDDRWRDLYEVHDNWTYFLRWQFDDDWEG